MKKSQFEMRFRSFALKWQYFHGEHTYIETDSHVTPEFLAWRQGENDKLGHAIIENKATGRLSA